MKHTSKTKAMSRVTTEMDEHMEHIQNVRDVCAKLGITIYELLKLDYQKILNNKTYTTEEITRRLKAGESVTCIVDGKIDVTRGVSYETKYIDEKSFKIIDDVNSNVWMMFAFNSNFIFTSDYEAMKSEENEFVKQLAKQTDGSGFPTRENVETHIEMLKSR